MQYAPTRDFAFLLPEFAEQSEHLEIEPDDGNHQPHGGKPFHVLRGPVLFAFDEVIEIE